MRDAEPRPLVAAPAASASARRCIAASAGSARISPPSIRIELSPSSRCSPSTSGPPEEPRGSGAVCSSEPPMRRPRGPAERAAGRADRARTSRAGPRPPGLASANTGCRSRPHPAARGPTRPAGASPVSTAIAARSRSASAPATRPSSVRPSANVTATSSPRSTCALVSTTPSAVTTPDPRPQPRPRPTTEGPTVSAAPATASWISWMNDIASSGVTCKLQVTVSASPHSNQCASPATPRHPPPSPTRSPGRRPLDAARDRRAARRPQALQRAAGGAARHRAQRALSARLKALTEHALSSRSRTPTGRRGSSTSSATQAASWRARCGCSPTGARAAPAAASRCATPCAAPRSRRAGGAPRASRPWMTPTPRTRSSTSEPSTRGQTLSSLRG